jgi:hypothetical protein
MHGVSLSFKLFIGGNDNAEAPPSSFHCLPAAACTTSSRGVTYATCVVCYRRGHFTDS